MVQKVFKRDLKLMGNHFQITVVGSFEEWANQQIDAAVSEIRRIEELLSTFKETSETNYINQNAGIKPAKVSDEIFNLIERSLRISSITQGAFDISYGSIDKRLWNFDQTMTSLPSQQTASQMVRLINYRNIILNHDNKTVFLKEKGMRIGFGGIGKGYAAEMAKSLLKKNGVTSGIINASGDLAVWGHQPDGKPWTIGIAHPDSVGQPFSYLEIADGAVATSGNYEKYVVISGKNYSHTIDPKTGFPVRGIKSVTIISPNAEICDAIATPVTILGVELGIGLVNQINGVECVIIDDHNNLFTSKNIHLS